MGVKVSLIAFPSSKVELIFNEFPTTAILTDAVANAAEAQFSDLIEGLETDSLSDYEQDFNEEGSLVLDATIEGERAGVAVFEVISIY